jgi:hypothetical protein
VGLPRASSIPAALLLGIGVLFASRSACGQVPAAESPLQKPFSEFGRLETQVRQVRRTNCWTLVVHGRVHNPYDEPVVGVRLIVRLRTAGDKPRELERIETQLETAIEAGQSVPFDRELPTACTNNIFNDIAVVAFAQRRAREVEVEAGRTEEAAWRAIGARSSELMNSPG